MTRKIFLIQVSLRIKKIAHQVDIKGIINISNTFEKISFYQKTLIMTLMMTLMMNNDVMLQSLQELGSTWLELRSG